jgi:hypothetical protein
VRQGTDKKVLDRQLPEMISRALAELQLGGFGLLTTIKV